MTDHLVDGDLTLRRAVPSDVPDVRAVYSEPDTRHWMLWDDELPDDAEALANIERSERAWAEGSWAVFRVVVDGHVVGGVNLSFGEYDTAETSYFLRASARGRGLATRAVLLAADWGFRERGVARVFLRVNPENARRWRWQNGQASCSRVSSGSRRHDPNGRRFDSHVYSLLPSERVSVRPATLADVDFLTDTAITATQDQGRFPADVDLADTAPASSSGPTSRCAARCPTARPRSSRLTASRSAGCASSAPLMSSSSPGLQLLPAHQSRGIGTRIIGDLVAEARASGRRFELSVDKDNVRAQALYERLGMVQVGETDHDLLLRLV